MGLIPGTSGKLVHAFHSMTVLTPTPVFFLALTIFSGYFLPFTLQGKNNHASKNNLRNVHLVLVLKAIFGGSLKITLQNKNNPCKAKITLKDSLGAQIWKVFFKHCYMAHASYVFFARKFVTAREFLLEFGTSLGIGTSVSGISKPMVCQIYRLHVGRLSRKRRKSLK